jgi:hypothetical protein
VSSLNELSKKLVDGQWQCERGNAAREGRSVVAAEVLRLVVLIVTMTLILLCKRREKHVLKNSGTSPGLCPRHLTAKN